MKRKEFNSIIKHVPEYKAQFKIQKLPQWLKGLGIKNNDLCIYNDGCFQFTLENGKKTEFNLPYENIEFVGYIDINSNNKRGM